MIKINPTKLVREINEKIFEGWVSFERENCPIHPNSLFSNIQLTNPPKP